jgi:hypothetical protein
MPASDIALIIGALATLLGVGVAGTITAIAALRSSNYNAAKITDFEKRLGASEKDRKAARKRVNFLKRLLMKRESENNILLARDKNWAAWGDTVGKMINQLQLEVGALQMQLRQKEEHYSAGDTQPIPPIPHSPLEDN